MKVLLSSIGLLAMAFNAKPAVADSYNFVFSKGGFSTIGGMSGSSEGLVLKDVNGNTVWSASNPDNATPCAGETSVFHLTSSCWSQTVELKCTSHSTLVPSSCSALIDGTTYWGEVDNSDNFIGIAISTSGYCGGAFDVQTVCSVGDIGDFSIEYEGTYWN